jgi:hypothetical protein
VVFTRDEIYALRPCLLGASSAVQERFRAGFQALEVADEVALGLSPEEAQEVLGILSSVGARPLAPRPNYRDKLRWLAARGTPHE